MLDVVRWVPESVEADALVVDRLAESLFGVRWALLTGAGFSTASGIPDYRGEETARRARNPIRFQSFVKDARGRQRYWARSMLGWEKMVKAEPNAGHRAVAALGRAGLLAGVLTQNVDSLHRDAGSHDIVELHGALRDVVCLNCRRMEERAHLQERLRIANPGFTAEILEMAPDGDVDLPEDAVLKFRPVACQHCGGMLKPHVVFFGEGVPKERVERAYAQVDAAEALVVAGSSLTVFSGYRFVKRARADKKPVYIVNIGQTRADAEATMKVQRSCAEVFCHLRDVWLPEAEQ